MKGNRNPMVDKPAEFNEFLSNFLTENGLLKS